MEIFFFIKKPSRVYRAKILALNKKTKQYNRLSNYLITQCFDSEFRCNTDKRNIEWQYQNRVGNNTRLRVRCDTFCNIYKNKYARCRSLDNFEFHRNKKPMKFHFCLFHICNLKYNSQLPTYSSMFILNPISNLNGKRKRNIQEVQSFPVYNFHHHSTKKMLIQESIYPFILCMIKTHKKIILVVT